MPGSVSRTSTFALNNVTLPFILEIANKGWIEALLENQNLLMGLNVHRGNVTCAPVAHAHGLPYVAAEALLREVP
jgi:alanine dehydrogenase